MTREELEATDWAIKFKKDDPYLYEAAIIFALDDKSEFIIAPWAHTDYAIACGESDQCVIMEVTNSKEEAIELCKKMGWKFHGVKE